jgi:hypothetical protein
MGRKKLKDVQPRTLNLDVPSYEAILTFWRRSNAGISGSVVVRELVRSYGRLCQQRINAADYSIEADVANLDAFAADFLQREGEVTR